MCDPDTINPSTDLEPCDLVYADYVVENRQLYYSAKQRWFYLSDQMPNEAWVFLQSDTDATTKPGEEHQLPINGVGLNFITVPHTAFPIGGNEALEGALRESIEVRALVFHGGFEVETDIT